MKGIKNVAKYSWYITGTVRGEMCNVGYLQQNAANMNTITHWSDCRYILDASQSAQWVLPGTRERMVCIELLSTELSSLDLDFLISFPCNRNQTLRNSSDVKSTKYALGSHDENLSKLWVSLNKSGQNMPNNKTGNVCINVTLTNGLKNHCFHGKAISITYSECVSVALVIQHAMHICHIVICDCPALIYLSTFLLVGGLNQKCGFWFLYNFSMKAFSF